MMKKQIKYSVVTVLCATLLGACGSSSSSDKKEVIKEKKKVEIQFDAKVGAEKLVCSDNNVAKKYNLGTPSNSGTISDFRFFVSNVSLIKEDGSKEKLVLEKNDFQYESNDGSTSLLDFEDNTGDCVKRGNTKALNTIVKGMAPDVKYKGIEFTLGVPFKLNHTEFPDEKSLTQPGMDWGWQAGRRFAKMELKPTDNEKVKIWNFHLGSVGCKDTNSDGKVDNCTQANRVKIEFADFDLNTQKIVVDYNALLSKTNITVDNGGALGCMSALNDPECKDVLPMIGLDFEGKTGNCKNGDCSSQKLFSIESK